MRFNGNICSQFSFNLSASILFLSIINWNKPIMMAITLSSIIDLNISLDTLRCSIIHIPGIQISDLIYSNALSRLYIYWGGVIEFSRIRIGLWIGLTTWHCGGNTEIPLYFGNFINTCFDREPFWYWERSCLGVRNRAGFLVSIFKGKSMWSDLIQSVCKWARADYFCGNCRGWVRKLSFSHCEAGETAPLVVFMVVEISIASFSAAKLLTSVGFIVFTGV